MPKFDVVVGNPPYQRNLHLKFLELSNDLIKDSGLIIWIHPARWIQDPLGIKKKNSDFNNYKDLPFIDFKIITANEGRKLFNIGITTDLVISSLQKGEKSILDLKKVYQLRNIPYDLNIVFETDLPSLSDVIEKDKRDGIRVQIRPIIPKIGGGAKFRYYLVNKRDDIIIDGLKNGKEWSQTTSKNQFTKPIGSPIPLSIKFNSITEAQNFIDSTFTDFYSFLMFLSKTDVHVQVKYLPFMMDYTKPWTDRRFREYFNISDENMDFIHEIMKKENVKK